MYISRDIEQWNAFLAILRQSVNEHKEQDLLMMLLTADERDAIGLRLQIIAQLLEKKLTQREIQQSLNTSAATITRGSNALKSVDPELLQWVCKQLNIDVKD